MNHARVWAKVRLDATGNTFRLPVILLLSEGRMTPLEPLLRYFVERRHVRSLVWMTKLCEIVGQLLEYIEANRREGDKPVNVFEGFVNALYNGTFDENNGDPSGQCWFASNTKTVNQKLYMLEEFYGSTLESQLPLGHMGSQTMCCR